MKTYLFRLLLLALTGQHALAESSNSFECTNKIFIQHDFAGALACQLRLGHDQDQFTATLLSFAGEDRPARAIFDQMAGEPPGGLPPKTDDLEAVDAVDFLSDIARDHRLLLVNEAHHVPETRLLTALLLKPLFARGFRYLAIEALNEATVNDLNRTGTSTYGTGYYTVEPTFAAVLQEAKRIGFRFVAYEFNTKCDPFRDPSKKCQNLRERGQARNIVARILSKDPRAKILVHAGYGHIDKKGELPWRPMARYLWEQTGIEPFSVDQTRYHEHGRAQADAPEYRELISKFAIKRPSILVHRAKRSAFVAERFQGHYDAQVILPALRELNGTGDWRRLLPGVHRITLGAGCAPGDLCVLRAMSEGASPDAVPSALTVIRSANQDLYLKPGRYRVFRDSALKGTAWQKDIVIREAEEL